LARSASSVATAAAWSRRLYSPSRRHSSAVEQLFRKSPALCAVLPRVEARYKRAHLLAVRIHALPAVHRRAGPMASKWTQTTCNEPSRRTAGVTDSPISPRVHQPLEDRL
jgi:hypothetical protein